MQKEYAERVLARRRLIPFTQRMNPRYLAGWVHKDIARRLERFSDEVAKGLSPRLMILMPPRHGKSELASRMFPAWHLGRNPHHEIIACSYNVGLAMTFSRKVQEVFNDPNFHTVFDVRLDPNHKGVEEWSLEAPHRGSYLAAGIGGGIAGKGCNILIVDDPIKNAEEADSADTREKNFDWYASTAYTRLAPGGGVLVIETWWHDDDLAGRLQVAMAADPDADQFEVVKYPAFAEHDEYIDTLTDEIVRIDPAADQEVAKLGLGPLQFLRSKGEPLHPERYDVAKLNRIRKTLPPRFWSALYQQNPTPDDGAFFTKDQFRRCESPQKERCNAFIAWDFAISEKKVNDWTVGSVTLQDEHDQLHVVEVVRFKSGDADFIVKAIVALASKWYSSNLVLGFEDGQIYRAMSALIDRALTKANIYPPIQTLKPLTDKLARARTLQGRMQAGVITFNDNAEWYETVRNEMLRFPAGLHDDCVDSLAWNAQLAIGSAPPAPLVRPKPFKSWRDRLTGSDMSAASHMAA